MRVIHGKTLPHSRTGEPIKLKYGTLAKERIFYYPIYSHLVFRRVNTLCLHINWKICIIKIALSHELTMAIHCAVAVTLVSRKRERKRPKEDSMRINQSRQQSWLQQQCSAKRRWVRITTSMTTTRIELQDHAITSHSVSLRNKQVRQLPDEQWP